MNNNNNHWRGRGNRGHGNNRSGGGNRNYDNNDYNNTRNNNAYADAANISITSRLGPTNNPINDRIVHNSPQNSYNNNSHYNDNQQQRGSGGGGGGGGGGGRAFNNYRGNNNRGSRGGRGGAGGPRFTREFVDEDIDMKPDSASNIVTVTGYPPGSEEKVMGFLTRKSKTDWVPLNIQYESNSMYITVTDDQTADSLCRIDGYSFGNATLHVVKGGPVAEAVGGGQVMNTNNNYNNRDGGGGSRGGNNYNNNNNRNKGKSNVLAEFLQERWNPQVGFLDMDELPPTSHNIGVVISRLLTEAKNLFGDSLKTISFARNKLWSVVPLTKAAELFPNLQNLSIAENDIAEFRSLDKLGNKFNNLQELMLSGNPIQNNNDLRTYQREVMKRFPTILFLDVQPVNGTGGGIISTQSQQQPQLDLPMPIRSNLFDQEGSSIAAQDLLSKYFPLFDTNRTALLDLYDAQAIFSVVFSNQGTFQQRNVWGNSSQASPVQRMVVGNENIVKRLLLLPATIHDLSRADNFVTDAWQTVGSSQNYPVVLFLVVHGEFVESPAGTPLSFDRTFLVAPSIPGSRAHSAGWSYVILSDSFIVRNYSCKPGSLITA